MPTSLLPSCGRCTEHFQATATLPFPSCKQNFIDNSSAVPCEHERQVHYSGLHFLLLCGGAVVTVVAERKRNIVPSKAIMSMSGRRMFGLHLAGSAYKFNRAVRLPFIGAKFDGGEKEQHNKCFRVCRISLKCILIFEPKLKFGFCHVRWARKEKKTNDCRARNALSTTPHGGLYYICFRVTTSKKNERNG